jgi:hypothetical protein
MIENLDFLQLRPFPFTAFREAYFAKKNHVLDYQDNLSQINDVIFPLSQILAIRFLSNLRSSYILPGGCEIKLLEGNLTLETINLDRKKTKYSWLNRLQRSTLEKTTFAAGDSLKIPLGENRLYLITLQKPCVLAHWNYQTTPTSNIIGNFEMDFFTLSHPGRKLIKLSRNLYANERHLAPEELKLDFFKILKLMRDEDLFFVFATQSYMSSKLQQAHFQEFIQDKFGELL